MKEGMVQWHACNDNTWVKNMFLGRGVKSNMAHLKVQHASLPRYMQHVFLTIRFRIARIVQRFRPIHARLWHYHRVNHLF